MVINFGKGVWGVVKVFQFFCSCNAMRFNIQLDIDQVVHLLLPAEILGIENAGNKEKGRKKYSGSDFHNGLKAEKYQNG